MKNEKKNFQKFFRIINNTIIEIVKAFFRIKTRDFKEADTLLDPKKFKCNIKTLWQPHQKQQIN